tara:strand:- start:84 stop:260 length:177 start_codon:yes stop_codon:yes gene_type:complete
MRFGLAGSDELHVVRVVAYCIILSLCPRSHGAFIWIFCVLVLYFCIKHALFLTLYFVR